MKNYILVPFLYLSLCPLAQADTVTLKSGESIKGLAVEHHSDRIIFSTVDGEKSLLLQDIQDIKYDDPEQSFLQIGKKYEEQNKLGESLAYYEKALEINPDLEEARKAASGVRNRFWAETSKGPKDEIQRQQLIYDAWGQGRDIKELMNEQVVKAGALLRKNLGLTLEKKDDWVRLQAVSLGSDGAMAGLKHGDRLVSVDGVSLRYLTVEVVQTKMLMPRYSSFNLEIERDILLPRSKAGRLKDMGFDLKLEYQGLVIDRVEEKSIAAKYGLKTHDLLVQVEGKPTRYLSLKEVKQLVEDSKAEKVKLSVRRGAFLSRK